MPAKALACICVTVFYTLYGSGLLAHGGERCSAARDRATDRHCRKMRRNNKFGAKNCNLATTIGERKIASENFCLTSERYLQLKLLPRAALC